MKKLTKSLIALGALFLSTQNVNALDVIAAHPTKNEIAVIGGNQVLYILNSEDFSVIKRVSLDYASDGFDKFCHYSADGKYLLFNSFMEDFKYFNTESYTVSRTIEVSEDTYSDPTKSKILTLDADDGVLKIIDFNSGVQKMQANFEKFEGYGRFIGASLNTEKNKVFMYVKKKESKEKKESYSYSDFKEKSKIEEITTRAKNDGETSEIYIFDLETKTLSAPVETWMSGSSELEIYPYKDKYYCVGSSKVFSIDEAANVEIMEFEGSSVSASLFIAEKNLLVLISSRDVEIFNVENGEKQKFSHGISMDFIRGATYANGWIYFCTGNYRVSAISTDGGMKEVKHVF